MIDTLVFDPFQRPTEIETNKEADTQTNDTAAPISFQFPLDYKAWQEQQDQQLLNAALEQSKFNQRKAAELLGLSYHQLRGMVRKYDLTRED